MNSETLRQRVLDGPPRGELAAARRALDAIAANAEAWHGLGEDGPRRALAVIAGWARDPSSVPPHVGERGDGEASSP